MKKHLSGVAIAGLGSISALVGVFSQTLAQGSDVLVDYRIEPIPVEQPLPISGLTEQTVLQQVVSASDRTCRDQSPPRIIDHRQGAFTTAGVNQSLYIVDLKDGCQSRANGTKRLALFVQDRLVLTQPFHYVSILKITDVDHNGVNEILAEAGATGQGYLNVSAFLLKLNQDQFAVLKDLGNVYSNNFGTTQANLKQNAAVLSTISQAGKTYLRKENYTATCSRTGSPMSQPQCSAFQRSTTQNIDLGN